MRHVYYIGWLMQIVSEASRILREGGILFLQVGSTRDESDTLVPIDMLIFDAIKRTGLNFQSRVAWVVSHGLTPKKRLSERYETRSEEHTSELQSLMRISYAVFCLKKNKTIKTHTKHQQSLDAETHHTSSTVQIIYIT